MGAGQLYPATGRVEYVLGEADVWCVIGIQRLETSGLHARKYVVRVLALLSLGSALGHRLPPRLLVRGLRSIVAAEQGQRDSNQYGSAHLSSLRRTHQPRQLSNINRNAPRLIEGQHTSDVGVS